jgi:prepilin-type N-terminal cleavage/methylation domain-containing protein/prepilin-type processing-associated H-X9-DG protein
MLQHKRGFTLIELLTVIALIAILAALLFPVFGQARAMARKSVCLSNFKQMMFACLMYSADYDEVFPIAGQDFIDCNNPPLFLDNLLYPYTTNQEIWNCPEDTASEQSREASLCDDTTIPTDPIQRQRDAAFRSDFALNWEYFGPVGENCPNYVGNETFGVPMAAAQHQSTSIYATDSVYWRLPDGTPVEGGNGFVDAPCRYLADGTDTFTPVGTCSDRTGSGWLPSKPLDWQVYGGVWPWHLGKVNVAFADGHVKTITIAQISAGCDVQDYWGGKIFDPSQYLWGLN